MSAEPSITPINYAQQASRPRGVLRRFWLPAFLLLVIASAYLWGPPLWRRVQLAYWYEQLAEHQAPAGSVVLDKYFAPGQGYTGTGVPYVPRAWERFYSLLSPPGFRTDGTAFAGGIKTADGRQLLVTVDVVPDMIWERSPDFHVRAFTPGAGWRHPKQVLDRRTAVALPRYERFRIYSGVTDPADPTHFTIPFEVDEQPGVIHGWIRENDVVLEPEYPATQPLTPPPPASPG